MKDTFSLMFICNIKSLGFAYPVLFFALQVAISVLISVNIIKNAPDGNPLNIPVGTSLDMVAAQVFALFVSLITQSDFLATFDLINVKYEDSVLSLFEGATRTKWIVSNICRFFVGVLSIAISFILIVQSTTVIELFFNFAAVQFVLELDNIAFQLTYRGYIVIGDLEETTRKLLNQVQFQQRKMVAFPFTKTPIPAKRLRLSIFLVHAAILYSAWSIVRKESSWKVLNWLFRSPKTEAYSLGDVPTTGWKKLPDPDIRIAYKHHPVYYRYMVNMPIEILFYSDDRFNIIERKGFGINPTLGVQDKDLAKLRDYFDQIYSVVVDSKKVEFYVNSYLDFNNTLTFVSELTTAMEPHSGNVKWRNDWPASGATLH
eukprot:scaffold63769_cov32-Attheya_sp.AAC.2